MKATALYDYEAAGDGEISIKEDSVLHVYAADGEWWLVKSDDDAPTIGYVPGNYLEGRDVSRGDFSFTHLFILPCFT